MNKLVTIIVDDNPHDLDYLEQLILLQPTLHLVKVCNNAIEALTIIKLMRPQVVFLDIDMPVFNGLELFKTLDYEPICVFVTAHSEYAWQSYEAMAFDFILKPVRLERLSAVVKRIEEYYTIKDKVTLAEAVAENDYIIVKEGYDKHKILLNDILYVEALKDYTKIVTKNIKVMTLQNLKNFMEFLAPEKFVRIHRSYAVAKDKITKLDHQYVHINNYTLPLGKTYKKTIQLNF